MSFCYHSSTTVSIADYAALRQLWEAGEVDLAESCILRVHDKPRTAAQAERLGQLLASVKVRKSDYSPESLTALWILKDERD
ncbi:ABC-type phosphate/phosphonate transport system substrate-binding protein [Granulicella aggregans]|uniref:ABC-type phosphate/phosphonate transport system substrate-binding protein n=1 Tax=Granulicella aggregans TaxID=474949 RepID=A0A7W7ZCX4_9BACT|nr:hypothetical protein [Granulicella aggregans]MBB5057448.1 ABC-type phosphate/phosphonate transport system substrate-binding protein [Granulicella aggregans]